LLHKLGEFCARPANSIHRCLQRILETAITIAHADKGNLQILDQQSGVLQIAVQSGFDEPFLNFFDNIKSNDPAEGVALAKRLRQLPAERRATLMAYGGDAPIAVLRRELPEIPAMSRTTLRQCGLRYIAIGWSGYVPAACRNSLILVPVNYAAWLWSWPDGFINRMKRISTEVFVVGHYDGRDYSTGIDSTDDLKRLAGWPRAGIWTNRIDRIAPMVRPAR